MQRWISDRHRLVGPILVLCGLLLVPWLVYLSFRLPDTARARNWGLMWTGVDVAEAGGLVLTGVLQWRRSPRRALPAAFTSALLLLDAWVDVTTSAPHTRLLAVIMAAAVEIPAAVACLLLALTSFPTAARPATAGQPSAEGPARRAARPAIGHAGPKS